MSLKMERKLLEEMERKLLEDLLKVCKKYDKKVSNAEFIGILEWVKIWRLIQIEKEAS